MKYPFSPDILNAMPEYLAELYRALELTLLEEVCKRLRVRDNLNQVTIADIKALRAHGVPLDEIKAAIRETTGLSERRLDALIKDAVARNQEYYSELITASKLTAPDVLVGAAEVAAIRKQTLDEIRNITRSMGFLAGRTILPAAQAYQWALDSAVLQMESGAISYGEAIKNAIKQLADSGLRTVPFEGRTDSVDVAVRRAVMTGVGQLNDKYTDASAEYLDSPYVEVSAHAGARDKATPHPWSSHKAWQGKVYYQSKHGEADPLGKYPDLAGVTGYGKVDGLCGANCRHSRHVWVEGVSERTYTDAQLAALDPPPFEYQGQTYTRYEATQQQRKIERTIRKLKREEAAYKGAGDKEQLTLVRARMRHLRQEYKDFSAAAGLRMQPERMKVYDLPKIP